jgi:hypothetical protein
MWATRKSPATRIFSRDVISTLNSSNHRKPDQINSSETNEIMNIMNRTSRRLISASAFALPCSLLFALALQDAMSPAAAQSVGDWQTTPGVASGYWANDSNNSLGGSGTWQTWNAGWTTQSGKIAGTSYPSNNVNNVITLLPGTALTNSSSASSLMADEITISNGASLTIQKGFFTLLHSSATTYDLDVFGSLNLSYSSAGGMILTNGATIAIESGGAMTNFSGSSGDNFAGPGYSASAITFMSGSTYVQTGSKTSLLPLATWNTGSSTIFAPSPGVATYIYPKQFPGQTYYNFTWNWPSQMAGGSGLSGNVNINGNFTIQSANGTNVEDVPDGGFTMNVGGNIAVTNGLWYPAASDSGIATVNVGGNFTIDSTAGIRVNKAADICAVYFNGTQPQTLAVYGTNLSAGNFTWTINNGATVTLSANSTLFVNSGVAGGGVITDNGTFVLASGSAIGGSASIAVSSGATLDVSQVGGYTLTTGQTLSGGGTIHGSAATAGTAVIHPGGGHTLTFDANLSPGVNGTNIFDLTSSPASGNDQVVLDGPGATLTGNGSQIAINSAGVLATSDYVLFNVTGGSGAVSGSFNPVPIWLGTTPANASDYSIVTSGNQVLLHYSNAVVPSPGITSITLSGGNLVLNGTNGVATTYYLLASTNLALPLAQWASVSTNTLSGSGNFTITATNVVTPNTPQQFYILQAP